MIPPTIPLALALTKRAEGDGALLDPSDENHPSHPSTTGFSGVAPVKKGRRKVVPAAPKVSPVPAPAPAAAPAPPPAQAPEKEDVAQWAAKTAESAAAGDSEQPQPMDVDGQ